MNSPKQINGVLSFVLLLSVVPLVSAQTYFSTLVGSVTDEQGGVVPNAVIKVTEVSTNVSTTTSTNSEGEYRIATLRPGEYVLEVQLRNFKNVNSKISLSVAQTSRMDVVLQAGEISENVMVTSEGDLIKTDTSELGTVMKTEEVEALPLNTRNFIELTYLVPGAVKSASYFGEPQPSVDGLGPYSNQVNVDGGGITSSYMNLPVERVSIDSIQEFKIETSNTSADHGLNAGATISIATKHGTNEFHGTAFEFFRNDKLNARNFFATTRPVLRYNEFGGNLGGPIIKNKLFFFGSYEGSRERRQITRQSTVPTLAERQGDFSQGTGAKNAIIYNPFDVDPVTGLRRPFPNNKIPESLWDPIAKQYLAFWPVPNSPGFPNLRFNAPSKNDFDRYAVRVDYNISDKDMLLGRFGHQSNPIETPGAIPGAGTGTIGNLLEGRNLVLSWTHIFNPGVINEARFSYAKLLQSQIPSEFVGQNLSAEFGFQNGSRIIEGIYGCPGIRFTGISTNGVCGGAVWTFPNRTYYFADDLTLTRGAHTFKIGGLHQRYGIDTIYGTTGGVTSNFNGIFTSQIGDLTGGQPFADFLLGALRGVTVNENPQISPDRRNSWQMYVQDDWKVSPKLSLQLGLRYDLNLPAYLADGRAGAWLEGLEHRTGQTLVLPNNGEQALAEVLKGQPLGFPFRFSDKNWLAKPNWKNFGPRLGFAYRPFNDAKTVIRGGYGVYYNMTVGTIQNNRNFGRPFQSSGSTPARPVVFERPPYSLGDAPVITPEFKPGEKFISGYVASPNWPDARVQQWNVAFQRSIGRDYALEVAYVGNKLTNGLNVSTWNTTHPVGYTFHYDDGSSFTITEATPLLQRTKYPELGTGTSSWPFSHTNYNALQLQFVKRMSNSFQFRAGYTWSRLRGQQGVYQDEFDLDGLDYFLAEHRPHNFYMTYVIQLPGHKMKGFAGALIGGWQLAGIVNLLSGARVNPYESQSTFAGAQNLQPVMLRDPNLSSSERTLDKWFDTGAFAIPGPNQYGSNSSIYSIIADSTQNFDMALSKYITIREGHRIQLRAEAFNIFNHPTFGAPNATRGTATFGRVTTALPAREIQLAIKYQF